MPKSVEFYFDFSSSYSYIALPTLRRLAEEYGCKIEWKPIALGAIFKHRGHVPPGPEESKGAYVRRDVERCARELGVDYKWPSPFPFNSIAAARVFYVIAQDDRQRALDWALAVFDASFGQGRNCSDPAELVAVAGELGLDGEALLRATKNDEVKKILQEVTAEAMERGVFGAPTFFLDGEMYWEADRLDRIENQLIQS